MPWSDPGGSGNRNGDKKPWGQRSKASGQSWNIDKITAELRKIGGHLRSGGGYKMRPPPKGLWQWLPAGVVGILLVAWLLSGYYNVGADQEGVVLRLGQVVGVTPPGSHFHWPYPLGSVELVDVGQTRRLVLGYGDSDASLNPGRLRTSDGRLVDVRYAADYRIADPEHYLFSTSNPQQLLAYALTAAMGQVIAQQSYDGVLHAAKAPLEADALRRAQALLVGSRSGIHLQSVQILEISPPKILQPEVEAIDKARKGAADQAAVAQDAAHKMTLQAQAEAATRITNAKAEAAHLLGQAKGDAARFDALYSAYQKNPQVIREQMYLQSMQDILGKAHHVVVGGRPGQISLHLSDTDQPQRVAAPVVSPTKSTTSTSGGSQ